MTERLTPNPFNDDTPRNVGKVGLKGLLAKFSPEQREARKTARQEARRHASMEREFQRIDRSKQVIADTVSAAEKIREHDFETEPVAVHMFDGTSFHSLPSIAALAMSEVTGEESHITRLIDEDPRKIMDGDSVTDPYWKFEKPVFKGRKEIGVLYSPTDPSVSYDSRFLRIAGPQFFSGALLVSESGAGIELNALGEELAVARYKAEQKPVPANMIVMEP